MTKVAVVYHSGYGHTARQARSVVAGAAGVPGVEAVPVPVEEAEARWGELEAADAIIFGSPTYMGSVSAPFKQFMDLSSKTWSRQGWKDKLAAGFTNSASWSGDKLNTLIQMAVFAGQHGMIWVPLGLPPGNNTSTARSTDLNRVGSYLGAMAQSNADQDADAVPPPADLETARELGRRVGEMAVTFARGRSALAA